LYEASLNRASISKPSTRRITSLLVSSILLIQDALSTCCHYFPALLPGYSSRLSDDQTSRVVIHAAAANMFCCRRVIPRASLLGMHPVWRVCPFG
jgi:DNA-directed RNA polymerase subunit N (RpoN/RPB10)